MGTGILYFFVIIIANTVGAMAGIGGGVIIKPVLDFIGAHPVSSVSFYSSVAVFTMAVVSTVKRISAGDEFESSKGISISFGAVVGGAIGNYVFNFLFTLFASSSAVSLVQIILLIIALVFAYIYIQFDLKGLHLKHMMWYFLSGILLGFLASLLGIGGGPINVSFLMLVFQMRIKKATLYSLSIILFSQLSKLFTIGFTEGFGQFDLTMLYFVIPAAILGGTVGSTIASRLSPKSTQFIFQSVIILVIIINVYNGIALIA